MLPKKCRLYRPVPDSILLILAFSGFLNCILPEEPCAAMERLISEIHHNKLAPQDAAVQLKSLFETLNNSGNSDSHCVFPVQGYDAGSIGGTRGSGFNSRGYRFTDGNRHKAHPAHDIFIVDRNQDCLDDNTGKPVQILAFTSGIVVATGQGWKQGDSLRSGNYVYIFHPGSGELSYYAHLNQVTVKVCQNVKAGETLGTLGRSGLNASRKRSPTHLHFSVFSTLKGVPEPLNPYKKLLKCKKS